MPIQQTIDFKNTYANELEGFYVPWQGEKAPEASIVQLNISLARELGLDPDDLDSAAGAAFFAGSEMPDGASPLAQVYAGHQFGGFSQQLGDGRALLVGEVIDRKGRRRDIQLKGSGRTPFSRGGDGKAVLGPVLREYLLGESMHALGIPTTRALAAVTTGEQIAREGGLKPGAVLVRTASSHLRVGTFQFFAARRENEKLRQLADYAIRRHFPDIEEIENHQDRYMGLLREVINLQAYLIAKWVAVGFVHGVMNTDNMTISGETIDYGPCAFIDNYDRHAVFSSIDAHGRYAYYNQPKIAQWNLARFAETLIPLIDPQDSDNAIRLATDEINTVPSIYEKFWLAEMRCKLGLDSQEEGDLVLVNKLHEIIEGKGVDFTKLFRNLAQAARSDSKALRKMFDDPSIIDEWLSEWLSRLSREKTTALKIGKAMDKYNPLYIPRNHKVEEALLAAAETSDFRPFQKLLEILENPYERRDGLEEFESPAPDSFGKYQTYCGT